MKNNKKVQIYNMFQSTVNIKISSEFHWGLDMLVLFSDSKFFSTSVFAENKFHIMENILNFAHVSLCSYVCMYLISYVLSFANCFSKIFTF